MATKLQEELRAKHEAATVVTQRQIDEARQRAIELCKLAYAAQPVKQPDGSTLLLCWEGRMHRAYTLLNEARNSGDEERLQKLQNGVDMLDGQMKAAIAEAEKAASDYAALCARLKQSNAHKQPYPPECNCEGCQHARRQTEYFRAEGELRRAVYDLMTPADVGDELPLLCYLGKDIIDNHLERIINAQKAYAAACETFGRKPDWHRVLAVYDHEMGAQHHHD